MAKRKTRSVPSVQVMAPKAPRAPRASGGAGGAVVVVRETAAKVGRAVSKRRATGNEAQGLQRRMQAGAIGGAGVGFIEKHWGDKLPTLPMIGRKGAIALAVYMFKPKSKLLQDVGVAAATLSGYQYAKESKVDGDDDDD